MEHTDEVNQHLSETFHLVLSISSLSSSLLSVFFLCLLSLLSLSLSPCVGGVCRCVWLSVCVVFVWCGVVWCGVVCGAWCGTLKTPCVDTKRLHVYIRNVPMYAGNTHTCFSTCVRGAGIHGDVLNLHTEAFLNLHTGWSSPVLLTMNSPRRVLTRPQRFTKDPLDLVHFQVENRSRTTCSRFLQSFALPDEAVKLQLSWGNVGGNQPWDDSMCLSLPWKNITNDLRVSISWSLHWSFSRLCPSHGAFTIFPDAHRHTHTHTHTHTYTYTNKYTHTTHIHTYTHTYFHIHIHIHTHTHTHFHKQTGDTEELNREGNEKRRRQRESRVKSGVEKKSSAKHWHKKNAHVWHGWRTETVRQLKLNLLFFWI